MRAMCPRVLRVYRPYPRWLGVSPTTPRSVNRLFCLVKSTGHFLSQLTSFLIPFDVLFHFKFHSVLFVKFYMRCATSPVCGRQSWRRILWSSNHSSVTYIVSSDPLPTDWNVIYILSSDPLPNLMLLISRNRSSTYRRLATERQINEAKQIT